MPRDLPSLNAIRVFEAAARHTNFSRAADELNVTQSAVSRQIMKLEDELGTRLFVRRGPRLVLTATGAEYLDVVQSGLSVIRRGTTRLFRQGARPVLTLSVLPSFTSWLVTRVGDFERAHPDIALHMSATYDVVDFSVATDIDAAVRYGAGRWPGVDAELLVDDVIVPVCSPAKAARLKEPADLMSERLLGEDALRDQWGLWAKAAGLGGLKPTADRLSDDFIVQIQAATLGHGVALAPGLLIAESLRRGHIVCPFKIPVRSQLQYYFVYPAGRPLDPGVAKIKRWMQEAAEATVAGMYQYWGEPTG